MEQRLERNDIRLILACAAICVVCLSVGTHFFYDAFPEATIDFRLTRDEARDKAASFLGHRGFDLASYRHAAVFRFDDLAKTFLERELGLAGASDVIDDPVRLWRWSNRWFRELQKEEFRVQYTVGGELVGFAHLIEEDATGASLPQTEARSLAEQFLSQALGLDLAGLEFVEAETTQRPHRVDHSFTWKLAGFEISESTYRHRVTIQGDLVGAYAEFLKVPESWRRQYDELRAANETTGLAAGFLLFLTWLAILARLVSSIRNRDVRWKTALVFGAIAFVLTFLAQLNSLPVTLFGFDTTSSYGSFLTESVLAALAMGLAAALGIAFLVAGAEPEYRRAYGGHVSISEQFLPDGIRTKRFLLGTIIGLTLTAVFLAYQTLFYLVADHFGAWSPADIRYSEMVNTHIPWIVVLLIGFMPAVSEEFMSRAFSIPFLHRLLKHRWLAILLSAVIWGFAHASYPQQPFWIRGVEVGLAGVALGYVVVRWGLLPALVWHYTIDAALTALVLLRSSNPYFVVSAAVSVGIMLIPLAVAILLYVRSRYFIDPVSLLNREDTPPLLARQPAAVDELSPEAQILSATRAAGRYHPLPPRRLAVVAGLVLVGLTAYLFEVPQLSPDVDFAITAGEAQRRAVAHLEAVGVTVDSFRTVVSQEPGWDATAVTYRHEIAGQRAATALYEEALSPAAWRVRLYQPLEKEEWRVLVRPEDGTVYARDHRLAEEQPGGDQATDAALAMAREHLRAFGLDPDSFTLKESSAEKLPARRDHLFVFEALEGDPRNLEESLFRCEVQIAGDRPAGLRRYVKLPEEWLRERDEDTLWRTVLRWLPILGVIAIALHLLWVFITRIRSGELGWRRPLWLGAVTASLFALGFLNDLPVFYADYPTQIPAGMYLFSHIVIIVMAALILGIVTVSTAGLVVSLYPGTLERLAPRAWHSQLRDAVLLSVLAVAWARAGDRLGDLLAAALPTGAPAPSIAVPDVSSLWPAADGLLRGMAGAIIMPLMAAIVVYYAVRVIRRPSLVVLALLAFGAATAGAEAYRVAGFFYEFGGFLFSTAVTAAAIAWLYRDNILAYLLTGFLTSITRSGVQLIDQPAYQVHGWVCLGIAILIVAGVCALALRTRGDDAR